MGLFGSREEIREVPTEDVIIPEYVASVIPDVGEYFLSWLGEAGVDGPTLAEVAAHVNALRGENEWISLNEAGRFGINKWENGPLTFLTHMTAFDIGAVVPGWASDGLRGADKRAVKANVERVLRTQGHAAAAAWALAARPDARLRLDIEFLAGYLPKQWGESVQYVRNKDVTKAFKKWRR